MQAIADQLQGGDMALDYDQILAKRPASEDAIFAWYVPFISYLHSRLLLVSGPRYLGVHEVYQERQTVFCQPGTLVIN